jgi:hypothetical protein
MMITPLTVLEHLVKLSDEVISLLSGGHFKRVQRLFTKLTLERE